MDQRPREHGWSGSRGKIFTDLRVHSLEKIACLDVPCGLQIAAECGSCGAVCRSDNVPVHWYATISYRSILVPVLHSLRPLKPFIANASVPIDHVGFLFTTPHFPRIEFNNKEETAVWTPLVPTDGVRHSSAAPPGCLALKRVGIAAYIDRNSPAILCPSKEQSPGFVIMLKPKFCEQYSSVSTYPPVRREQVECCRPHKSAPRRELHALASHLT
ncbi:hypothetical protein Bbelb_441790, partial [Branchiostoma belcheri]